MTDNEIIKALECCSSQVGCDKCGYFTGKAGCMVFMATDALDLINRLKAKNKEFDEKIVIQMGTIDWQAKEINRQKARIKELEERCNKND